MVVRLVDQVAQVQLRRMLRRRQLHTQLRRAVVEHELVEPVAAELIGLVARERRR